MSDFPNKSMVMAAGMGLRMRPLTNEKPKPLIDVAGKPLIDWTLDWLGDSGVTDVVVNTHYKAGMLQAHLAKRILPHIHISHEDILLETGGGLKKALPMLGASPFFSANSDVICLDGNTPALRRLAQHWDDAKMDALLLLHPRERAIGFDGPGDFFLNDDGSVRRRGASADAPYVFTGVQLLHPRLLGDALDGAFSINVLYNREMTEDGTLPRICGLIHDGAWLHIGDPKGLAAAEQYLKSPPPNHPPQVGEGKN